MRLHFGPQRGTPVQHRGVRTAASMVVIAAALAACSSNQETAANRQAAVASDSTTAPTPTSSASTSPLEELPTSTGQGAQAPLTLGPAPKAPQVQLTTRGHVAHLEISPGIGSAPVIRYEARMTRAGASFESGRSIEDCNANVQEISPCDLASQTRGKWDVYARAFGKNGSSPWIQVGTATIDSCTSSDAWNGTCEVYDKGPGGGLVFYADPSKDRGYRYIEAAPAGWNGTSKDPVRQWCRLKEGPDWRGIKTESGIGAGRLNTLDIVQHCGSETAAGLAAAYYGANSSFWYLPSTAELNAMYNLRSEIGGLTNENENARDSYWSSERYKASASDWNYSGEPLATKTDLKRGTSSSFETMSSTYGVRPIRRF